MKRPTPDKTRRVRRYHGGHIWVDGHKIADRPYSYTDELIVARVRERTSDEWWLHAAEVLDAMDGPTTAGPLGLGVDFFAWEHDELVPQDVRDAIESDAYEAAREVIVEGIEAHLRQMIPAVRAVAQVHDA